MSDDVMQVIVRMLVKGRHIEIQRHRLIKGRRTARLKPWFLKHDKGFSIGWFHIVISLIR